MTTIIIKKDTYKLENKILQDLGYIWIRDICYKKVDISQIRDEIEKLRILKISNIEIILYENSLRLIRRVNEDFDENNSGRMFNSYNPLYSKILLMIYSHHIRSNHDKNFKYVRFNIFIIFLKCVNKHTFLNFKI